MVTAVDDVNTTTADGSDRGDPVPRPGTTVTIRYLRDDQPAELQVTLGSS